MGFVPFFLFFVFVFVFLTAASFLRAALGSLCMREHRFLALFSAGLFARTCLTAVDVLLLACTFEAKWIKFRVWYLKKLYDDAQGNKEKLVRSVNGRQEIMIHVHVNLFQRGCRN